MSVSPGFGVGRFGGFGERRARRAGFAHAEDLESDDLPAARRLDRTEVARELRMATRREELAAFFPELPAPGSSVHVVANGRFDFWTWCPHFLELLAESAALHASTWTMNRGNALELLELLDAGRLSSCLLLTGLYFKRRESAVYATLVEGLQARGQRYLALRNHAKVLVLQTPGDALVIEGSANFTANPRIEQYVVTRDRDLAAFHAGWMQEAARGE